MAEVSGSGGGASRRNVLLGSALGVASLAVLPLFSTPGKQQDPLKCITPDLSETEKKLVVSNWPAYIDEDADEASRR